MYSEEIMRIIGEYTGQLKKSELQEILIQLTNFEQIGSENYESIIRQMLSECEKERESMNLTSNLKHTYLAERITPDDVRNAGLLLERESDEIGISTEYEGDKHV